jgi:murein DD-endopeptidase MepM/ murein hydrolase activator NlpD
LKDAKKIICKDIDCRENIVKSNQRDHHTPMTQPRKAKHLLFQSLKRSLLVYGLVGVSGIELLSGGVSLAQTPSSVDADTVPSAQDLLSTPDSTPTAPAVSVPVAPESSIPTSAATQTATQSVMPPTAAPIDTPDSSLSTAPTAPPEQATSLQLNIINDAQSDSSAGRDSDTNTGANSGINPGANQTYIDPTNYSLGATQRPDVVLSERSTGCQLTLERGQSVPTRSICATQVPVRGSEVTAPRYMGEERSASVEPVRVSAGGFSVVGGTTPSGRDYYNLTARPPAMLGNGNLMMVFPLSIPAVITSVFGWRMHPITGDRRFHSGTDLGAPIGTPVLAAYAGQVAIADFMQGYGLTVVLQHDLEHQHNTATLRTIPTNKATEETLYGHMSELFVRPGEWVEQGEVIGRVGSTGNSTGPHLHFEVRQITPQGWLALDPGLMLEYSLAQFIRSLQTAQANPQAFSQQSGFSKAIVKDITQKLAAR